MAVIMFMSLPFIIGIMVDIRHQELGAYGMGNMGSYVYLIVEAV